MNDLMKYLEIIQKIGIRSPWLALVMLATNFNSFESLVTKISIQWIQNVLLCTYAIAFIAVAIFTFRLEIILYNARRMKPCQMK